MPDADLYLTSINLCRYWPANVEMSCTDFIDRLADKDLPAARRYVEQHLPRR